MPPPTSDIIQRRLDALRARMRLAGLDGFLATHAPNIQYLTGVAVSAGGVVVTEQSCVLVVDFRYASAAAAVLTGRADAATRVEITDMSLEEGAAAVLTHAGVRRIGVEGASMPVNRFNALSAMLAALGATEPESEAPALVPTEQMVERGRMVKDAGEIALLREGAVRAAGVAGQLAAIARPGLRESDIAAAIDHAMRGAGFARTAFQTIVASGPNGALPHARPGHRVLQPGDAVVLDFGGVFDEYCVDLSRTLLLEPVEPEVRRIFEAVREAHEAAIAAVRPGVLPSAVDGEARRVLERHGLGEAFGHGTGHGIGLEVHEDPRIARPVAGRQEVPLEAGMVFTIEPGAYVPGLGGVRIEDDVLVTADGCDVLTRTTQPVGA